MVDENTTPEEETSGMEDLRSALGAGDSPPWVDNPSPEPSPEGKMADGTGADGDTTGSDQPAPDAAAELSAEDISRVFGDPKVQSELKRRWDTSMAQTMQQARALWEQEQQQRQSKEDEALLDDEEFGRRQRLAAQAAPVIQRAQAAGYAKAQAEFFHLGVSSIWESVPELKELDESAKTELDPGNPKFRTYGDYVNAVVDRAASIRAEKQAAKLADTMAKAKVASELGEIRKANPSPRSVGGPAKAAEDRLDMTRMSGMDLLRAAFKE